MALFGSKKKKEVKTTEVAKPETSNQVGNASNAADAIIRPRITEKAGIVSEKNNAYTFEIQKDATKKTVAAAVKILYKVTPKKIAIVRLPARQVVVRGKKGTQSAIKKAVVYLNKGDKIEFV
ncbi:MAG: 50S ribosomal protein L23 [Patescibacteria group bacterium]